MAGEAAGFAVLSVFVFTSDGFLASVDTLVLVLSSDFLSAATGEPVGDATGEAAGDGLAAGVGVEFVAGVFGTSGVVEQAPMTNAIEATNVANINDLLIVLSYLTAEFRSTGKLLVSRTVAQGADGPKNVFHERPRQMLVICCDGSVVQTRGRDHKNEPRNKTCTKI